MRVVEGTSLIVLLVLVSLLCIVRETEAVGPEKLEGLVRNCAEALKAIETEEVEGSPRRNQRVVDALGLLHSARVISYQSLCRYWGSEYGARELFFSEVIPEVKRLFRAYANDMRAMNDLRATSGLLLTLSYPPSGPNDCRESVSDREELEQRLREITLELIEEIVDVFIFAVEEKARVEEAGGGMGELVPTFLEEYKLVQLWGCNVIAKLVHRSVENSERLLDVKRAWAVVSHLAQPNNLCHLAVKEVIELLRLDETLTDLHLALTGGDSVHTIVELVKEHSSDADYINKKYARDWTALMAAVTHENSLPILLELVKVPGLDINAVRLDGWSALDLAVDQNLIDQIRLLVRSGANSLSMDQANHYNVDVAHAYQYPLCEQEGDRCIIDFSRPPATKQEPVHEHDEL